MKHFIGQNGRVEVLGLFVWGVAVCSLGVRSTRADTSDTQSLPIVVFEGSTIIFMDTNSQPGLIYQKYPTDESVGPATTWQLSFGAVLDSVDPSINVTLSVDPLAPNADIQILDGTAILVPQDGLYSNYDPLEHFELMYTGTLIPFVGPVDFILTPEGFAEIPLRVHLNITDQAGFPIPVRNFSGAPVPLGDITGDGKRELVVANDLDGEEGLYAFDHTGNLLSGWPLRDEDPDVFDQGFFKPAIADLDGDGQHEVIVLGFALRNVPGEGAVASVVTTLTLYVVEGSGVVRWQVTDDFTFASTPAVADIDGDGEVEILIGLAGNLAKFSAGGVMLGSWQVETPDSITIQTPLIADVDGNPFNGLEIVACAPPTLSQPLAQLYVWRRNGSLFSLAWPKAVDRCIPPAVLELDLNHGNGLEIMLAYDHESPPVDPGTGFVNTFSVYAWHVDGTAVAGWPHDFLRDPGVGLGDDRIVAPISAGDVDGDGDMEIVVGTYGQGDPANGNLFLFHHDGTLAAGWPQWAGLAQTPSKSGGPALGDLDGDGLMEIVTGSFKGVYVFRADGSLFEGFPIMTRDNFAQATIADLDGDGTLEIAELTTFDRLYVWHVLAPSSDPAPWPRFRQNLGRTGSLDLDPVANIPTVSEIGLVAFCCLLVGAGTVIIRRGARQVSRSSDAQP